MCPPATNNFPSAKKERPAQKIFAPTCAIAVFVFVAGSQRYGLSPLAKAGHHRTLPVGRSAAWTALYGHGVLADHCQQLPGPGRQQEKRPITEQKAARKVAYRREMTNNPD